MIPIPTLLATAQMVHVFMTLFMMSSVVLKCDGINNNLPRRLVSQTLQTSTCLLHDARQDYASNRPGRNSLASCTHSCPARRYYLRRRSHIHRIHVHHIHRMNCSETSRPRRPAAFSHGSPLELQPRWLIKLLVSLMTAPFSVKLLPVCMHA